MPNNAQVDISEQVMSQIARGRIRMRPRWVFLAGSMAMAFGMIGVIVLSIFFVSLTAFSLRTHGPMGAVRFEQLLQSFPWWAPMLAVFGIGLGGSLLKRYDFSYKRNFRLLFVLFVLAIILAGWSIDVLGLDRIWIDRGLFRGMHQNDTRMRDVRFFH